MNFTLTVLPHPGTSQPLSERVEESPWHSSLTALQTLSLCLPYSSIMLLLAQMRVIFSPCLFSKLSNTALKPQQLSSLLPPGASALPTPPLVRHPGRETGVGEEYSRKLTLLVRDQGFPGYPSLQLMHQQHPSFLPAHHKER